MTAEVQIEIVFMFKRDFQNLHSKTLELDSDIIKKEREKLICCLGLFDISIVIVVLKLNKNIFNSLTFHFPIDIKFQSIFFKT